MTTLQSILVLGPTGSVGLPLCKELISNKANFKRIAAFNNTSRPGDSEKDALLAGLQKQGMEIISGSYSDVAAFRGFDAVAMALGNFANYLQPLIIDTAIEAGVRHFYPSEFGADITVGSNWTQRYYRDKVITREHLMKRAQKVEGLGWTYITIGRFAEYAPISYFGIDNATHSAEVYGTEDGRQSLISVPDTVIYIVHTLLDVFDSSVAESRQRTYRFQGQSISWKELFDILKRITGHEYKVTYHSVEEALAMSKRAEELKDDKLAMQASHRVVQGSEGTLLPEPWDNSRFPEVEPKSVEGVLKAEFSDPKKKIWYGL